MSFFAGDNLFDSGPHRFNIGGIRLRHATHDIPGNLGAQLTGQGISARPIEQVGQLIADDDAALRTLTTAIEAKIDGLSHELVDHLGQTFPNTTMLAFLPGPIESLGPRLHLHYRINYLQLTP